MNSPLRPFQSRVMYVRDVFGQFRRGAQWGAGWAWGQEGWLLVTAVLAGRQRCMHLPVRTHLPKLLELNIN